MLLPILSAALSSSTLRIPPKKIKHNCKKILPQLKLLRGSTRLETAGPQQVWEPEGGRRTSPEVLHKYSSQLLQKYAARNQ